MIVIYKLSCYVDSDSVCVCVCVYDYLFLVEMIGTSRSVVSMCVYVSVIMLTNP